MKVYGAVVCDCSARVAFRIEDGFEGGYDTVQCWDCGLVLTVTAIVSKTDTVIP